MMKFFKKKKRRKKNKEVDYTKPSKFSILKFYLKKFFNKIGKGIKKYWNGLFGFLGKFKNNFLAFIKFLIFVLAYGFIINYSITCILGFELSLFTVPAWGIYYYIIKEEFPEWFRSLIGK